MSTIRRILCATDFSIIASHAFEKAQDFAADTGAELLLLHAFETPETLTVDSQSTPADHAVTEKLRALAAKSRVPATPVLHAGPAGEVICWVAQERNCDLIVLGTHGRTGLVHLLLGSVSEHVMRHARCPVLTVRMREAKEPKLAEPVVLPLKAPPFM